MNSSTFIGIDLGAGSGRVISGTLHERKVSLKHLHRFSNNPVHRDAHIYWNTDYLCAQIIQGLKKGATHAHPPESIAIDTWGVDYVLLDKNDSLLGLPHCYRDPRNVPAHVSFQKKIDPEKIYARTGIQILPFNTLFQLHAHMLESPSVFDSAKKLLFMPDYIGWYLSGTSCTEFTIASTSQLLNPLTGAWDHTLFEILGIDPSIMQPILKSTDTRGILSQTIQDITGLPPVPLIAAGAHDTASAVAAVPAHGESWAYLSSGTWSLIGIETPSPILSKDACRYNFTNEGGVDGSYRFLKNIAGLWLFAECKRIWDRQREHSFEELIALFNNAEPFRSCIDPDWPEFLSPVDMPRAIAESCAGTAQPVPESKAQIIRTIFESLALKYRYVLDQIRRISDKEIDTLYVVGGGAQNQLLCQCTANATGCRVCAGPIEATAVGNILVQAMAKKQIESMEQLRTIVRNSFQIETFYPQDLQKWESAYERFIELIETKDGDNK